MHKNIIDIKVIYKKGLNTIFLMRVNIKNKQINLKYFIYLAKLFNFGHSSKSVFLKTKAHYRNNVKVLFYSHYYDLQ